MEVGQEQRSLTQSLPNGLFLMGTGLAVVMANGLLLNPFTRTLLAVVAAGWGGYLLLTNPRARTTALASLAAGGILLLFGNLFRGLVNFAGIGLMVTGVVSFVSGLFRR